MIPSLLVYGFCCYLNLVHAAERVFVNVYLKPHSDHVIVEHIKAFNQFWATQKAPMSSVSPYLTHYPAHITLYLAHYNQKQLPTLLYRINHLAQQERSLKVDAEPFRVGAGAYIMLGIKKSQSLQSLSDRIVFLLKDLRDRKASIPAWAAQDQNRQALFSLYGSPGVLARYEPHVSVLAAPSHLKAQQNLHQWQQAVTLFNQHTSIQPSGIMDTLAVGIANEEGQIIAELASYHLNTSLG